MKHLVQIQTAFKITVEVEADSREEAEEKVWEIYNSENLDPLDTNDIDTDTKWLGYAEESDSV